MNNYTVVWRRRAQLDLAVLWIRAANKEALAGYAEQIDRILSRDPNEQGEGRSAADDPGGLRLWFHRPIAVLFEVDEAARTVRVARIKWVGR